MGRKGVSKRKKAKVKELPVTGKASVAGERKVEHQPEQVTEKYKVAPKGSKKR